MNKAMKSATHGQDPTAGVSINQAMRVQLGRRQWIGSCNACTDGVYDTEDGIEFTTEVQMRQLTFRLCQCCRMQLKGML